MYRGKTAAQWGALLAEATAWVLSYDGTQGDLHDLLYVRESAGRLAAFEAEAKRAELAAAEAKRAADAREAELRREKRVPMREVLRRVEQERRRQAYGERSGYADRLRQEAEARRRQEQVLRDLLNQFGFDGGTRVSDPFGGFDFRFTGDPWRPR